MESMIQTHLAVEQAAGEVHGEVLNPNRRIPARRDGAKAERVGAGAAGIRTAGRTATRRTRLHTARREHSTGRGFKKSPHVSGDQWFSSHRDLPFHGSVASQVLSVNDYGDDYGGRL
jgi:hypothetical protein